VRQHFDPPRERAEFEPMVQREAPENTCEFEIDFNCRAHSNRLVIFLAWLEAPQKNGFCGFLVKTVTASPD
jgi:hypothetical protein